MEKLISMTEFVLSYKYNNKVPIYNQQSDKLRAIINYANFLNKPLELGFFVPCDLDGNVLEFPNINEYKGMFCESGICKAYEDECKQYEEAKKRVLFKGFELIEISVNLRIVVNKEKDCQVFVNQFQNVYYKCNEFDKIEDLCKYDLTLTENALKQIGI